MKPIDISESGVTDRLAAQIDLLQEAFRTLSTASTLKDLAGRFVAIVRRVHAGSDVCLVHRAAGSDAWQDPMNPAQRHPSDFLPPPEGRPGVVALPDAASREIRVILNLVDLSAAGIIITCQIPGTQFAEEDLLSARLFAHLFDNAYQAMLSRKNEKGLIFSLNHRVLQLNSLIDTGIEVARLGQDIRPEHMALQRAASLTNASRGSVTVTGTNGQSQGYFFPEGSDAPTPLIVTVQNGKHTISSSFSFGGSTYLFELHDKESRSGPVAFDDTDQLLLDALARQVHASLENHYLHAQALEKQKIEQDFAVAASIQQRILPTVLPTIDGYDVAGINIPSKAVGGDYYDCIALPDGRFALVIADVSGKGVPAALLVSSLHAYLSAYIESGLPLRTLAGRLNSVIGHASTEDKFITAFLGILTPSTGEFESLNAGHTSTFLIRADDSVLELSVGGIPFGMLDMDFPFQTETVTINPGDRLLLYTDGVTEAMNEQGELFDTAIPLKEFVVQRKPEKAGGFIHELITDIKRFTGTAEQNDDITALYLLRR
jgi:serine phosphatase RsbU (regulator of sigma subunit)